MRAAFDDAPLIGDRVVKTRGELIAEGFDEETIRKLPSHNQESEEGGGLAAARAKDRVTKLAVMKLTTGPSEKVGVV